MIGSRTSAERHVFHNREHTAGLAIITAAVVVTILIWMAVDTRAETPARLFGVGLALIYGFLGYRAARSRVYADASGVRIVNAFRTIEAPWVDIARFSVGRYGPYPKIGIAELKTGRRFHMSALQGPNPLGRPKNRTAETLVESLTTLLLRHRATEIPSSTDETRDDDAAR